MQTVVELPEFLRRAKAIMTDDERVSLMNYIAANPESGVPLGGGLRRFASRERWRQERGLPNHLRHGRQTFADLPSHRVRQE